MRCDILVTECVEGVAVGRALEMRLRTRRLPGNLERVHFAAPGRSAPVPGELVTLVVRRLRPRQDGLWLVGEVQRRRIAPGEAGLGGAALLPLGSVGRGSGAPQGFALDLWATVPERAVLTDLGTHARLGEAALAEGRMARAMRHFEVGVRLGQWALERACDLETFHGALPATDPRNRGFLACLVGLGRGLAEARACRVAGDLLANALWLDPTDPFGVLEEIERLSAEGDLVRVARD